MNGSNSISITGFADENLTTGELKASESYTEPSQESFYVQLNTVAQLSDTFTINAPGLSGMVGYLEIPFLVTGTTSPNGQGEISTFLSDPAGVNTPGCPTCFFAGNATVVTEPMSFHFGTPFNLFWAFGAVTYPSAAITGFSDYSNAATLQGFEVFNSDHQLISNETLTAPGGEQIALITSPEPASLLLVGLSLSFLFVAFRYRS
jgi:hypothetical protein